jgi:hypothetical protein
MSKKPDATVRVEIIPSSRRSTPAEAAEALRKIIQSEFARCMANREDFVFQPFFQQQKVAHEIRRIQSVPEQRKWSLYFEEFGCLICGTRKEGHGSCGMCKSCKCRTFERLQTIIKRYRRKSEEHLDFPTDRAELARKALAGCSRQPSSDERGTQEGVGGSGGASSDERGTQEGVGGSGGGARMSVASKKAWVDPAVRARMSAARKKAWADPAVRARMSAASKKALADPAVRARMSAASKKAWADPAVRARMSAASKKAWADPAAELPATEGWNG